MTTLNESHVWSKRKNGGSKSSNGYQAAQAVTKQSGDIGWPIYLLRYMYYSRSISKQWVFAILFSRPHYSEFSTIIITQ